MIPRKEAKRLLEEFLDKLATAEEEAGEELDGDGIAELARKVLAKSDLVLRGAENVEQKARRYLAEGRLTIRSVTVHGGDSGGGLIVAEARGGDGIYLLGYDPARRQWRCTCRSGRKGQCSHVIALKLVTDTTTRGAST